MKIRVCLQKITVILIQGCGYLLFVLNYRKGGVVYVSVFKKKKHRE